ncbi:MAG: zinc ribbon domain-containing protein [Desulfarculaceae bacterium]|nr:zinc ribbon domain-containing protein [Desulfarculaceae bacterium]
MPIYEFRCEACEKTFEHLAMTSGEVVEIKCPSCGSDQLARVMSTCASVVNGSKNAPSPSSPSVENRSCPNSGNCGTLTLPGVD